MFPSLWTDMELDVGGTSMSPQQSYYSNTH